MSVASYVVGNGLGNIIQTTPACNFLRRMFSSVEIVSSSRYREFAKAVYDVEVLSQPGAGAKVFKCCNPNEFYDSPPVTEVELNLRKVGCYSPRSEDKRGFCAYEPSNECFDILFCDGYNKRSSKEDWLVKSYPYWNNVVDELRNCSMASIGVHGEYIEGTEDRTGIGLSRTFGLIKNARLIVCNDTGFYHAANVLGTPCVVVFTMTDTFKNYDKDFHRRTDIVSAGLSCQPCQLKGKKYWLNSFEWCGWECRKVHPDLVISAVRNRLNG